MQNIIKERPKYYSIIINNPLELMDVISQWMHKPIQETYPYLSVT